MTKERILERLASINGLIKDILRNPNDQESCNLAIASIESVIQAISLSKFTSGTDLTGQIFGQLTVLKIHSKVKWSSSSGYIYSWACRCTCGNICYKTTRDLLHHSGRFPLMCQACKDKLIHSTHSSSKRSLYVIWTRMKQSCYDVNYTNYDIYGGKGIIVCDEWVNDYSAFEEWAYTNGYKEGLRIKRLNTNDNFTPQNCCFTSGKLITINGVSKTLLQWCKYHRVSYCTAAARKKAGLPQELWFYKGRIPKEMKPQKT